MLDLSVRNLLDQTAKAGFGALNSVVLPLLRRGAGSPLPIGAGLVVLETTGRTSGRKREVPLMAARFGDRMLVSTARRRSQWVRNLEAEPQADVWVAGHKRTATATVRRGPFDVARLALD